VVLITEQLKIDHSVAELKNLATKKTQNSAKNHPEDFAESILKAHTEHHQHHNKTTLAQVILLLA